MGTDFLDRVKKTFRRKVDHGAEKLRTPNLFTKSLDETRTVLRLKLLGEQTPLQNEDLILTHREGRLYLQKGTTTIATTDSIDTKIQQCFVTNANIGVATVVNILPISRSVEITCANLDQFNQAQ